jgi:NADPH:quinone reductase-like Zn-dependent oxidoreductase
MKRVVVERFGGPDVLIVVEDEDPRPGPGEVCVRVVAAGASFTDTLLRDFAVLLEYLATDKIHPVVAERVPLTEARRAHEMLPRTAATGKVVLVP